jgi:hypothetical protein
MARTTQLVQEGFVKITEEAVYRDFRLIPGECIEAASVFGLTCAQLPRPPTHTLAVGFQTEKVLCLDRLGHNVRDHRFPGWVLSLDPF